MEDENGHDNCDGGDDVVVDDDEDEPPAPKRPRGWISRFPDPCPRPSSRMGRPDVCVAPWSNVNHCPPVRRPRLPRADRLPFCKRTHYWLAEALWHEHGPRHR